MALGVELVFMPSRGVIISISIEKTPYLGRGGLTVPNGRSDGKP